MVKDHIVASTILRRLTNHKVTSVMEVSLLLIANVASPTLTLVVLLEVKSAEITKVSWICFLEITGQAIRSYCRPQIFAFLRP